MDKYSEMGKVGKSQTISLPPQINKQFAYIGKILVFGAVYFLAARVGYLAPFDGAIATLIWPASALSLAVLVIWGWQFWPGIALGALLVTISNHNSLTLTLAFAVTQTVEPLIGALILSKRSRFNRSLASLSDVFQFVVVGALITPLVGAILGSISFAISPEPSPPTTQLLWHWWLGHAISYISMVPAVLTIYESPRFNWHYQQVAEFLSAMSLLIITAILVFVRLPDLTGNYPLVHAVFPFVMWIAMRFTAREVSIASLVVTIIALLGTVNGSGPFSRPETDLNLILLATFVGSVVVIALIICAILNERRIDRQSLKSANEILEQHVQQRTAALLQTNQKLQQEIEDRKKIEQQLAHAHEETLEALKTKSQILANVSHDARTPLNIITLYTEMLQRELHGPLTDRQRESLDIILGSSHELLNFINNLLDEAQLQSKRIKAVYQLTNVSEWLMTRTQYFKKLAERKNLTFDVIYDKDLPAEQKIDTEGLKQIIDNLISNALKFTKQGGITVHACSVDKTRWGLHIQDTGSGIPQEALQFLFDPFWQLDGSTTREINRGVGLGLSIVRQRVELLNGTIEVTSEEGQGTTFH